MIYWTIVLIWAYFFIYNSVFFFDIFIPFWDISGILYGVFLLGGHHLVVMGSFSLRVAWCWVFLDPREKPPWKERFAKPTWDGCHNETAALISTLHIYIQYTYIYIHIIYIYIYIHIIYIYYIYIYIFTHNIHIIYICIYIRTFGYEK